jgi:hypothetical protein
MIPKTASVIAEDAPLGVQLWPTLTPESAPNFTLDRVEIIRGAYGSYVRWVYQNDNTRTFRLGERVAIDGEALGEWIAS